MFAYLIRKTLLSIPILLGVVTLVFLLLRVVPVDPVDTILGPHKTPDMVAQVRAELHLDQPVWRQYLYFLEELALHGNLGKSYRLKEDVTAYILRQFPRTLILALAALTIAVVLGVGSGVLSAVFRASWIDNAFRVLSLVSISMPSFVLAILMSMVFGYYLRWFPINGFRGGNEGWYYLCLPALALGTRPLAMIMRLTRASLLEVIHQDYIRTARAKGVPPAVVVIVHGLRNAMIPVATAISGTLADLLAGSFFIEMIFQWPGLGKLSMDGIQNWDFAIVQGTVLFAALIFVAINLLLDVVYAFLDPRISYH